MVRGTSRRVIVVESPDTNLFEQAIFIVRNDALSKDGVTAQQLVDEACRVARSYTRSHSTRRPLLRCGSPVFWSAAGALGIALVWLLTALVGGRPVSSLAGRFGRPALFVLSKKWQNHFFEKASLRSAPRLSAESGQFDAHSAQSVFCRAQVAAENESYRFRVCGRETLRGFSIG